MMVELMFNKELTDVSFEIEALDEWKKVAGDLGLDNQLLLAKGKETPIPYPFMNESMFRVYNTLCPMRVDFKAYKKTTIPLEVLQQISFSVKEKHFDRIEVWYDDKDPDPLVVGYRSEYYSYDLPYVNGGHKYFSTREKCQAALKKAKSDSTSVYAEETKHLIARWGDELREFSELKSLALARVIDKVGNDLIVSKKKIDQAVNLLKENAKSYLSGDIDMYELEGRR